MHIIYAKEWGGGETCAYQMCKVAGNFGNKIFTVIDKNSDELKSKFAKVSRVIELNLNQTAIISSAYELHEKILELQIDIIHTHTGKVVLLAALAKTFTRAKIIAFRHNVLPNKTDALHKFLYSKIDAFICVSRAVYKIQTESIFPEFRDKFFIVHNGIEPVDAPEISRSDKLTIGFAGRIDASKGLNVLIDALNLLKDLDVELKIAGDFRNDYFRTLERQVKNLNLENKIQWLGFQNDMAKFYQSIDIFVMPSIVAEAFGMVLCEAMNFKKPVIATDSGAQSEIVDDGLNGYIVPKNDSVALARRIKRFIDEPELIEKFGREGRAKVLREFTMEKWLAKMREVYEKIGGKL